MDLIDKLLTYDYIAESIPLFLVLIAVEIIISVLRKDRRYQFGDTLANLGTGSIATIAVNLTKGFSIAVYALLFNHFAIINMQHLSLVGRWIAGIVLLFAVDCLYYWFHRFTHRCNVGWIGHSVHHQSEEYNFSVALRQGFFQPQMSWITYLPLAVIGFPPVWLVSVHAFMISYQFWIHTEAIKKMGPLEYILNTPSHHRVHHGVNKRYLDKNYAGVFIIWDKFFGTFEPEEIRAVYGTTTPLSSWNPFVANAQHIVALREISKQIASPWKKFKLWFMPPEWRPEDFPPCHFPSDQELDARKKFTPALISQQLLLSGAIFVLGVAASVESLSLSKITPTPSAVFFGIIAFAAYLGASLVLAKTRV